MRRQPVAWRIPLGGRTQHDAAARHREEKAVIIRVFRPTVHPGKQSEFEAFLRDTAIPLVSRQKGLVAQQDIARSRDGQGRVNGLMLVAVART